MFVVLKLLYLYILVFTEANMANIDLFSVNKNNKNICLWAVWIYIKKVCA